MKILRWILPLLAVSICGALRAEPVAPTPAPAWTLKDVNGADVKLDQFKGKVVVLDFWATWCGPCRSEIPGYIKLQKKYAGDGLVIVGVATNDGGPDVVKSFMKKEGMNYQVVIGDDDIDAAYGGIEAIPTTFIIDRTGKIVDRKVGAMSTAEYEKTILSYLKPKA